MLRCVSMCYLASEASAVRDRPGSGEVYKYIYIYIYIYGFVIVTLVCYAIVCYNEHIVYYDCLYT